MKTPLVFYVFVLTSFISCSYDPRIPPIDTKAQYSDSMAKETLKRGIDTANDLYLAIETRRTQLKGLTLTVTLGLFGLALGRPTNYKHTLLFLIVPFTLLMYGLDTNELHLSFRVSKKGMATSNSLLQYDSLSKSQRDSVLQSASRGLDEIDTFARRCEKAELALTPRLSDWGWYSLPLAGVAFVLGKEMRAKKKKKTNK
jgi:hypothetical protein